MKRLKKMAWRRISQRKEIGPKTACQFYNKKTRF